MKLYASPYQKEQMTPRVHFVEAIDIHEYKMRLEMVRT